MKKTLVALAVLAASGATLAQSSVTLSGRVDTFLGTSTSTSINTTTGASEDTLVGGVKTGQTGLFNGGLTGSRWAMSGTEDLGGGLKAMFKLENRFDVTDGTDTGGFLGDAFVALGGGFGTVKLGRTYTAFDDARAVSNGSNVFDSSFTAAAFKVTATSTAGVKLVTGRDYSSRSANSIRYESPVFSGVSAAISYGMGENATATFGASSTTSLHVKYAAGPLVAALGYQDEATPSATTTANEKFTQLSAAYDFGMASVSGGYEQRRGTTATGDDNGWNLGVNVPFGAAAVSIGFGNETTDIAGVSAKTTALGLGATYSMSKRTMLYTGWTTAKVESNGFELTKTSLFGAGVKHLF